MAERWSRAECVGLDIMPLQHEHQLPNCTYLCVNVDTGMDAFADSSFDIIHLRQMLYCVSPCSTPLLACSFSRRETTWDAAECSPRKE